MTRGWPGFVIEAARLLGQRRVPEAIRRCRQGLLGDPRCLEGRLLLAVALLAAGQYEEVLGQLDAVAGLDAERPLADLLRGEALLRLGSRGAAEQALLRARSLGAAAAAIERLVQDLSSARPAPQALRGVRGTARIEGPGGGLETPPDPVAIEQVPTAELTGRPVVALPLEGLDELLAALRRRAAPLQVLATVDIETQELGQGEVPTREQRPTVEAAIDAVHDAPTRELAPATPDAALAHEVAETRVRGPLVALPTAVVADAVERAAVSDLAFQATVRGPLRAAPARVVDTGGGAARREPLPRGGAEAVEAPAELSGHEIETVSQLVHELPPAEGVGRRAGAAGRPDDGPIELSASAVEIALPPPERGTPWRSAAAAGPPPPMNLPASAISVLAPQPARQEVFESASGLTTSAPLALQEAEISLMVPVAEAWPVDAEPPGKRAGARAVALPTAAASAADAQRVVVTWDPPAEGRLEAERLAPSVSEARSASLDVADSAASLVPERERTEALGRSGLLAPASGRLHEDSGAAADAGRGWAEGGRPAPERAARPVRPSRGDSAARARSWGSRSEQASAGSRGASSLGRSWPVRRFRAPSLARERRGRPGWWELIAGDPSAQRWALGLIGSILVVTLALMLGFAVRGYRLRQASVLRLQAARERIERGNLADYIWALQLLRATSAAGGGTGVVQQLQGRLVGAIPVEFGDAVGPSARVALPPSGAWESDEQAAHAVYLQLAVGQLEQAEQLATRAGRSFPESALVLYLRGRLALLRGEPERAQQWLAQAAQRAPRDALTAAALGEALRQRGEPSMALEQFTRALRLNPAHVASALGRARCLLDLDRPAEAGRQLRELLHGELRPAAARGQQGWAWLLLGQLHRAARDPDEARRDLQQARNSAPIVDPVFLEELAGALMAVDRVGEAETVAAAAAALMPGRPRAALLNATVLLREGRLHEAREQARRASALSEAALVSAEVELRLGRVEEAARTLRSRPVVASSPAGQLLAARVAAARGEQEEALAIARELAAGGPDRLQALTVVGWLLLGEGRLSEARQALEQALRQDADALEPRLALVQVMLAEHALTAARDELLRLVRAYPWSTVATKRLATLELGRHDLLAARQVLEGLLQRVPRDDEAQLLLVRVRVAGYELEAAEQLLLKIEGAAAGQRDLAVGRLALAADDGRRAVGHLLAAVRALPHDRDGWSLLVQAYLAVDRPDRARQAWQGMLRRFPRAWQSYESQGRLELSAARPHAAALALRQALAVANGQGQLPAEAAGTELLLGVALQDGGDLRQALEAFSRAEAICPLCPEAPFRRGLALQELRRPAEAITALVRAARLSPRMAQIYYALGKLYQSLDRRPEALRMYRQYLELNPPEELGDDVRRAMAELQR